MVYCDYAMKVAVAYPMGRIGFFVVPMLMYLPTIRAVNLYFISVNMSGYYRDFQDFIGYHLINFLSIICITSQNLYIQEKPSGTAPPDIVWDNRNAGSNSSYWGGTPTAIRGLNAE